MINRCHGRNDQREGGGKDRSFGQAGLSPNCYGPEIVDFWGMGGPGGPKNHSRWCGASPPTFWNLCLGRRGRQNPQNNRFPAGPKTMY